MTGRGGRGRGGPVPCLAGGEDGSARPDASAWAGLVGLLALTILAAAVPERAAAQEVAFTPRSDRTEERRLARFLEEENFTLWTRDTVVARGDTVGGPLLVLDATVRFAGHLDGPVKVVGGDLFLRPDARVDGDLSVLGGGYYASDLAAVEGEVTYRPNLLLRVVRRDDGWEIVHVGERRDAIRLHGLSGFHLPQYSRVAGWTLGWGGRAQVPGAPWQPSLEAVVRVNTEGTDQLEGTVRQFWHPTGDFRFGVEAERVTRSNDQWMKSDIGNSLRYLLAGDDFRDYYRSERVSFRIGWPARQGWGGSLALHREDAESVEARSLAVLFDDDDDVRPNPAVDEGTTWSVGATVGFRRRQADRRLRAELRLEGADSTAAGDFSFLLGQGRLSWRRPGLADGHRLHLFGITRFDLAGTLPQQRRSSLGGDPTLPTLGTLERRGERLFFVRSTYLVPVEPLRVPVMGTPQIFVRNSAGAAWNDGETLRVEDNVGAGVRFLFLEAGGALDVTRSDLDPEFVVQAVFPAGFQD